jgi:dTDP-4-dehydrorhamnose reductase
MKEKVLLLSKGYVSSKIKEELMKDSNIELINVSRNELDYTNQDTLINYIEEKNIRFVVNTYGYTGKPNVDACEYNQQECYNRNVKDNLTILRSCRISEVPFIHIDSGCVYSDESGQTVFKESTPANFGFVNPTSSFYSSTKDLFQTEAKKMQLHDYGYIFRIRMPYDECMDEKKNYLHKIKNYDMLVNYWNSLTNLRELAKVVRLTIEKKPEFGVYNIVDTDPQQAEEIIFWMGRYMNYKHPMFDSHKRFFTTDELLTKGIMKVRRSNCILDNTKIQKALDFEYPSSAVLIQNILKQNAIKEN